MYGIIPENVTTYAPWLDIYMHRADQPFILYQK